MHLKSALSLRNSFLKGEVKAEEIVRHFIQRIEKHNSTLGAFLTILEERALAKAKLLDQKWARKEPLGKLAALPIGIKDNMHIKGEITTCASHFLKNYRAPFDASVVRFMEEEDGIMIGKLNMDEFAMGSSNENSSFFPVKNPWDLERVPGGSSGGSSAAVAARLVPIATGSDTGGSIRQPAAFTGIVGYKPTYGRVSRFGLVAFGSSLDQIGPMTTCVQDAALVMEVIGRHCKHDSTTTSLPPEAYLDYLKSDLKGKTIGVPWNFLEGMNETSWKNFKESIAVCQDLGAEIIDVNLDILKYSIATYYILSTAEASTNLARFDGIRYGLRAKNTPTLEEVYDKSRDEGFGKEVKKRILLGTFVLSAGHKDAFYQKAQKVRTMIIHAFDDAFETCDLIAMPVSPFVAFQRGSIQDPIEMYLQDIFTISANLAGLPAISVPSGFHEGMPLALQLLGPQLHDEVVLSSAYAFEQAKNCNRHPKDFA